MGWIRVEGKPREVQGYQDGKTFAVLDLQVATAADLPELGGVVENYIVAAGSTAQIVEVDEITFVTLSGDSEEWWPDQSGTKAGKTLSASPTLKKAVDESDGDTIDLTEDDIDKISDELGLEPFPEPVEEPVEEKKAKATESEVTEDER